MPLLNKMHLVKVVEKFNFWNRILRLINSETNLQKGIFLRTWKNYLFSKSISESDIQKILFQKLNFSTTFSKMISLKSGRQKFSISKGRKNWNFSSVENSIDGALSFNRTIKGRVLKYQKNKYTEPQIQLQNNTIL